MKRLRSRPLATLAVLGVVLSMALAGTTLVVTLNNTRDTAIEALTITVERQAAAARGSCARLQIVRDDANALASVQYRVIKASMTGSPPPLKLRTALARVDSPTRDLLILLLAGGNATRRLYPDILRQTRYLPPTDLKKGCGNPNYRPPSPVQFSSVAACFDAETNPHPIPGCKG